ncbi:hypothetical protein [Xanthocytophaga flava]|uniref:hypothetical protein n=1 Tax=Xanthocytophaga flava TaxID=3048013 RepID=UPI0028D2C875|nr:hypothetical protein [Xanthocytophaga flavus]MDJ1470343.1 hypothetical protein [Xanthocytophaga flavus]
MKPGKGGAPDSKTEFAHNHPIIKQLFDLLEKKLFQPNNLTTNSQKADFIHRVSQQHASVAEKEYEPLNSRQIRERFIIKYQNRKPVSLTQNYWEKLRLAISFYNTQQTNQAQKLSDLELSFLNITFKNSFDKIKPNQPKTIQFKPSHLPNWFNSGSCPQYLENSEWYIFERIGKKLLKNEKWGIAVGSISFKKNKDLPYLEVTMTTMLENRDRIFKGIASKDTQNDYLYLDLVFEDDSKKRSNIILRLAEEEISKQTILIGHYSYHSKLYRHLLSKTVILLKKDSIKDIILKIESYYEGDPYFEKIPIQIAKFLYFRERNRMSMPKEQISSLEELNNYLVEHRRQKIDRILNHFTGKYYVYFQRDGYIEEDSLFIDDDKYADLIYATFEHSPDIDKKNTKRWKGQVFLNEPKQGIILELSNEKSSETNEEYEDPILLTFNIPDELIAFEASECFPGIISGLSDKSGPIAYLCLVVKQKSIMDVGSVKEKRIKIVTPFFSAALKSYIRPTANTFKLNQLGEQKQKSE